MKCLTATLLFALSTGCSAPESPANSGPDTEATNGVPAATAPQLTYSMSAEPATIYKQEVPSTTTGPRTVAFTLVADNKSKERFNGEAPTSAIVRVVVKKGEEVIWDGPEMTLQVITPVELAANSKSVYSATWEIADVTKLPLGEFEVTGTFIPTGGEAKTNLWIKEKM